MNMCKSQFLKDVLSEMTTFGPGEGPWEASKRSPGALETAFERVSKSEGEKRKKKLRCYTSKKKVSPLKPFPNPFLVPKTLLRLLPLTGEGVTGVRRHPPIS